MVLNELDIVGLVLRRRTAGGLGSSEYAMAWNFFYWAAILTLSTGLFAWFAFSFRYKERNGDAATGNAHVSPKTSEGGSSDGSDASLNKRDEM